MSQTKAELVNGLSINAAAADALTINSNGDITFAKSLGIGAATSTGYQLQITGQSGYDDVARITGVGTNIGPRLNFTPTGTGTARINATANNLELQTGGETALKAVANGAVELYNDNSKKFNTNSGGVDISGHCYFPDNNGSYYGTGEDFRIYHNGTNSEIKNTTGVLYLESDGTTVTDKEGSDVMASFNHDGACELYYDNSKKLETNTGGVKVTGTLRMDDGSTSTNRLVLGTGGDFLLFHDGSTNIIDSYSNLEIKYGSEKLAAFAINGQVELYYNNVKKFETLTSGVFVHGICEVYANTASNYAGQTINDGDSTNRYGHFIKCGADDAAGTNYALGVADGDGTTQGYLTFSGGTLALDPFTAAHPCIVPDADNPSDESMAYPYGTLLETTAIEYKKKKDGSDTERGILYKVQKTQSANSKKVLGAYAGSLNNGPDNHTNMHHVYVLGDGHILVNNAGGNIEIGDGICSSATAGIGQKATANPSMIIGIAQEAITFTGSETKLVAVQYGLQQFIPWT